MNYLMTQGSITLTYDGKTKVIAKGDTRFEQVLEAIRSNNLQSIPEIVETERAFEKFGLKLVDGLLTASEGSMPVELSGRILAYKDANLPYDSLLKFWENLKLNPSFNSRKQLFKFLENQGHSLTEDGCFVGYRGVREDFKDIHSGQFDNSPGQLLEMPREQVDDNPDNTCSHGFHVGGYGYAKDFAQGKLVLVKVNPKDVVAVPNDYNGQKMRVCKFEVLSEVTDMVKAPLYNPDSENNGPDIDDSNDFDESDDDFVEPGHEIYRDDNYSDNEIDEVLNAESTYNEDYDGESLVTRISEEVSTEKEEIREILERYA